MIIILSIIVGYVLGIAPFLLPKLIENINFNKSNKEINEENNIGIIIDEYLNGNTTEKEEKNVNANILQEYLTGIPSVMEDK